MDDRRGSGLVSHFRVVLALATAATLGSACEPWADEDLAAIGDPAVYSAVSAGLSRTCGIGAGGAAYCWGEAILGTQQATGLCAAPPNPDPFYVEPDHECVLRPIVVSGDHRFVSLAAGPNVTVGVDDAGIVWGWGLNWYGLLGAFSEDSIVEYPRQVVGTEAWRFTSVSVGVYNACGVTDGHAIVCWGAQSLVTTGVPNTCAASSAPCGATAAQVGTGLTWVQVVVGDEHACALDTSGAVYCWGNGAKGQLGSTPLASCPGGLFGAVVPCRTVPTKVSGTAVYASLAGAATFNCGITSTTALLCWGTLGTTTFATPLAYTNLTGWTAAAIGAYGLPGFPATAVCGIRTGGTLWCFGPSQVGGNNVHQVSVAATLVGVTVGGWHVCGWDTAGAAWCFGDNSYGALGTGDLAPAYSTSVVAVSNPFRD